MTLATVLSFGTALAKRFGDGGLAAEDAEDEDSAVCGCDVDVT